MMEPGVLGRELRNVRLLVAYDGTDFRGFAQSDGVRTIMGVLTEAVARITRMPAESLELVGSGRTDAGVHGWGQVVNGLIPADTDLHRLTASINALLRPEVSVRGPEWADPDFSARFSATSRTYRYAIWNDRSLNPLLSRHAWHLGPPLDVDAMNEAALDLLGDHDFSSFCRKPKPGPGYYEPSMKRTLQLAQWTREPWHDLNPSPLLRFEVTATSFCHQMVRSIVGTLVDVGFGRLTADSMPAILAEHHRNAAGQVAPPHGLTFHGVSFLGTRWDARA
ncbi:tRNA pseudouridine(38-40) synthase TruA [Ilumatobacter sp.]|uniref:tRNA pseudouridine(38-40) synthase TruA n=1 Tax=Ilumatobacter sp. TaxID=1967498 RepID=UPI0037507BD4